MNQEMEDEQKGVDGKDRKKLKEFDNIKGSNKFKKKADQTPGGWS